MKIKGTFTSCLERSRRLCSAFWAKGVAVTSALVSSVAIAALMPSAFAGGGGGSDNGNGTTPMATQVWWAYRDNNDGGFGGAEMASINNAFATMNVTMLPTGQSKAFKALHEANTNCQARFNEAHPDQAGQGKCRVVSVGVMTGEKKQWSGMAHHLKSDWLNAWALGPGKGTYKNNGTVYTTGSQFDDQPGTSVDSLVDQYTSDATTIVVIMLNQYEPKVTTYRLTVETAQQGGFPLAGGSQTVSDLITSKASTDIREDLNATSTLVWAGYNGTPPRSVSKPVRMHNDGHTNGPVFKPDDFGWRVWPAGSFGYRLDVPKQGRLEAAVSLDEHAPHESWQVAPPAPRKTLWNADNTRPVEAREVIAHSVPYVARVSAQTAGSSNFWLYDVIHDEDVWIGAVNRDDPSQVKVTDSAHGVQAAEISIDRSQAGSVVVKAHPVAGPPRELILHVPTYPKSTGKSKNIRDDSKSCWSGDGLNCLEGNHGEISKLVPQANKVWVVDEAGAMVAADPAHTNAAGKDNRTFIPGNMITAVVNGRIPAHLTGNLDAYVIKDDWTDAAPFVDFTDVHKVKVYVDGSDRTSDFDIKIEGAVTVAVAKPAFLRTTGSLPADKMVKLIIAGKVKDVSAPTGQRFANSGFERWGEEGAYTNIPAVFVRTPDPNKVWVVDLQGALKTADPERTNQQGADTQVFLPGDEVGGVVNGKIPKNLATNLNKYVIADDWEPAAKYVDFTDVSKAKVYIGGVDRTSDFDIHVQGTTTIASAKASVLKETENLPEDKIVKLYVGGSFKDSARTHGKLVQLTNKGWEQWDNKKVSTNEPPVFVWTPNPDKSWVLLENGNPMSESQDYKLVIDPKRSNTTGADGLSFRQGDRVAAAINATIPAQLARIPNLVLTDDWKQSASIVRVEDVSHIRIYDKAVSSAEQSSVQAIDADGRDVTDQFTISLTGTVARAVPKPEYAENLCHMEAARQITMLVPFQLEFDPESVRKDYGKQPGDQLDSCKNPDGSGLSNKGNQQAGQASVDTNEPVICITIPSIHKDVIGEASQGGSQESVDGKTVMPGQKLEYTVRVDPNIPANNAYDISKVAISDTYDMQTIPDKQTLEIHDLTTGRVIPRSQWSVNWDDPNHTLTVSFGDAWVKDNWRKGSHPRILLRFEARVKDDVGTDHKIENQAWLEVNNSVTTSNKVANRPPVINPEKQNTQKNPAVSIDGKRALLGDRLYYRITIDASDLINSAYRVQRLGIVDDYDQEYVRLDEQAIQVLDSTGADVTSKLNIQVKNGSVYAFFKTADTAIPATGEIVKGDPQPEDLQAYSKRKLDPLHDSYIDQSVLGKKYQLILPVTVVKVTEGYTVNNIAKQITDNRESKTNKVSNPLKPINPSKDIVVSLGGQSANHQTIYLHSQFLYRLDSSVLPSDRSYPKVTEWSIVDEYDAEHDKPTGEWAVYANRDLKDAQGNLLAKRGERIGGKGFDSTPFGGDLFTYKEEEGRFTIAASARYLDLVSAGNFEQAWSAYVQCTRYRMAESVKNRFVEKLNGVSRPSNEVESKTPALKSAIALEKYDQVSGVVEGNRNDPAEALENAVDGTVIVFRIINTGDLPLTDIELRDETIVGSGRVVNIQYPPDFKRLLIQPGEYLEITGELSGVAEGDHHTNRARVSGKPVVECPVVDDNPWDDQPGDKKQEECQGEEVVAIPDDWNGKRKPQRRMLPSTGINVMILFPLGLSALGISLVLLPNVRNIFAGLGKSWRSLFGL